MWRGFHYIILYINQYIAFLGFLGFGLGFIVDVLNKRQNKRQGVERVSIDNSIYKFIYCVSRLYSGCFE